MAKSFHDAHRKLTFTSSGYNHGAGHASQEEMQECLFELMRHSQEIRTASGEKVGPFETIDELSEFLEGCADREEDHLLIREFEGGEARMVSLKKNGYVDEYSGKTISPEGYLNESAPGELKIRNALRKPNGRDKFCDVIRGIFGSRDSAVKAYEDYQTRRSKFLSDHGFGKSEVMEVKDTDLDPEAPDSAESSMRTGTLHRRSIRSRITTRRCVTHSC